jgi:hypothetical protein
MEEKRPIEVDGLPNLKMVIFHVIVKYHSFMPLEAGKN